jgi:dipeptidyl aminopeptidase/acylaminoacyl peptidase
MSKWSWIFIVLACSWQSAMAHNQPSAGADEPLPQLSDAQTDRLMPYLEMRSGRTYGWWPGGEGIMIGTRFGSSNQMHLLRAAMGVRRQMSFGPEPVLQAFPNHGGETPSVILQRDVGGNENFQLYALSTLDLSERLLSEGGATRNDNPVFSRDGQRVAYSRTDASGMYELRIARLDQPGPGTPIKIAGKTARASVYTPLDFSPDGKFLLLVEYRSILQSTLYELDIQRGALRRLGKASDSASTQARYTKDGKQIYVLSDQGLQTQRIWLVDRKLNTFRQLLAPQSGDVEMFALSANENYLAISVNNELGSELRVFDLLSAAKEVSSVDLKPGVISDLHFHPSKTVLALTFSGARFPADTFTLDFPSKQLVRWTEHELAGIKEQDLVLPKRLQLIGGTGEKAYNLQTWSYAPSTPGKKAVVIILHGGPEGQARPGFDPWIQYLVRELDVAVLTPNVRGSTGYGRDYTALDNGMLRADATIDVGSLLEWLKTMPNFDAERVVVMGGSYGGYLTLASLVAFSDKLKGGISTVGISDFTTFLKNTANYRRDLRRAEYGDERDPKMRAYFDTISPLKNAQRITAPLLLIQGANDPRVPLSESQQIQAAVRSNGKPAPMLVAGDEGHGFKKRGNVDRMRSAMAAFLIQHLGLSAAAE